MPSKSKTKAISAEHLPPQAAADEGGQLSPPTQSLQSAAALLRNDVEAFQKATIEASYRMILLGLRIKIVKDICHDSGIPWLQFIDENIPGLSRRWAYYCLNTADKAIGAAQLNEKQIALLASGEEKRGIKKAEQMLMDFIGEDGPNDLMNRLGVRGGGQAQQGGNNQLMNWLAEHHPSHAMLGVRLKDLPPEIQSEWKEFLAASLNPGEKGKRKIAKDRWAKLMFDLEDLGLRRKTWALLDQAELHKLDGILIDLRDELKGALR